MHRVRWLLMTASLGLMLTTVQAADLLLAWDYPADVQPPPESFLVSYQRSGGTDRVQQFRIPNLGAASCDAVANKIPDRTNDTLCGLAPECLPPGMYIFSVQAESPEGLSAPSNIATCEARPGCTYRCETITLPPGVQDLVDAATGSEGTITPPDPQQLAEAIEHAAAAPTTPAPPSVTTAAPTIQDIVDQVQGALDRRPPTPV